MKKLTLEPLCLFGMIVLAQILISPAQSSEIYSYVDTNGVRHYTDIHPSHCPTVKLYPQPTSQSTGSVKIYRFVDAQGVIHLTDNPKNSRYRLIYQGGSTESAHNL